MNDKIIQGDSLEVLKTLPSESIDCAITSPPYWNLRDYGIAGQFGLESTFQEYIMKLCDIFDEVKRVLKNTGTCFVNLGDTYNGNKSGYTDTNKNGKVPEDSMIRKKTSKEVPEKSLCLIPSRFSIEMVERGWILRNRIVWHKPNQMPQSADDRFTNNFEDVFFFTKNKDYYFKQIMEPNSAVSIARAEYENRRQNPSSIGSKSESYGMPARFVKLNPEGHNKRTVWTINTKGYDESHFATFPEKLVEPMIISGCPKEGIVLDCFFGAGTTGVVANKLGRYYIGIELNPEYIKMAERRIGGQTRPML